MEQITIKITDEGVANILVKRPIPLDEENDDKPKYTVNEHLQMVFENYANILSDAGAKKKAYKEAKGIKQKENLRDYLAIDTLLEIQKVESDIAAILEFSKAKDDKEVYQEIKEYMYAKYRKQIV